MKRPQFVMAALDIVGRMLHWSDYDLHTFFKKLYVRKVDKLRILLFNVWGEQNEASQPYLKDEDWFDLDFFNPVFFGQLKRLSDMAYAWKTGLYIDLFDHCATKEPTKHLHPYYNNVNIIFGMYDIRTEAQSYRNDLAKKVIETVGLRGYWRNRLGIKCALPPNIFSLGNELYCSHAERHSFGEHWAYPLAHQLRELGYTEKIAFSASEEAAHAIRAYVNTEGDWKSEFKKDDTILQLHGMDSPAWVDENVPGVVHGRYFGISDDGTYKRNPSIGTVARIVSRTLAYCKEPFMRTKKQRYIHHIEMLPLSISEIPTKVWEIDTGRDLEVYSTIARKNFGIKKPNRETPRWLLKRNGLLR